MKKYLVLVIFFLLVLLFTVKLHMQKKYADFEVNQSSINLANSDLSLNKNIILLKHHQKIVKHGVDENADLYMANLTVNVTKPEMTFPVESFRLYSEKDGQPYAPNSFLKFKINGIEDSKKLTVGTNKIEMTTPILNKATKYYLVFVQHSQKKFDLINIK
ncbi:MAG: hypothetical protein SOI57_07965 [Leuconostoc gelidum]|jgi:hypothetical protein|uniref:hypothetical protein n=1 Tax=Leuconostoc gelidum TaxID=1244 RepID=UPI001576A32C|nr:hypothetical protein [Leuconostoc gelidum]MBZ5978759.1 hypothetical protein [Leuconostoc gelidum subsp. gelidum]MBZ6001769.1 hypothetical protein [Leuconostoc gelidum subsp. gelidum]QDJ29229.1 hypothetical protein BHS02_00440 [Leuconostoc gelidum subsp. gelidum]